MPRKTRKKSKRRAKVARRPAPKPRKGRKVRKRGAFGYKMRPTVYRSRKGWRRSSRSKWEPKKRSIRVNPKKRRSRKRRRTVRMNAPRIVNRLFNRNFLVNAAGAGLGVVSGALSMPLINSVIPAQIKVPDKFMGIYQIGIGMLLAGFVRNRMVKSVGGAMAAMGVYDIIASNVPDLGLRPLPRSTSWSSGMAVTAPAATDAIAAEAASASYETQGISYQTGRLPLGASYQAPVPTVGLGFDYDELGDNPYSDIDTF